MLTVVKCELLNQFFFFFFLNFHQQEKQEIFTIDRRVQH